MRFTHFAILAGLLLATNSACSRDPIPAACSTPGTAISAIQGTGASSPLVDQVVAVEGVVSALFVGVEALGGFFLQSQEGPQRGDEPVGSQGLFVLAPDTDEAVASTRVGERVRVTGKVAEQDGMTVLTSVSSVAHCGTAETAGGHPSPTLALSPAAERNLEAVEGMLVRVDGLLTVADTYALGRSGRWRFARGGRSFAPTNGDASLSTPSPSPLTIDDGSRAEPARSLPHHADGRPPRVGDQVASLIGVIVEDADGYALHPTVPFELTARNLRPATPPKVGGSLRIAAFNVLNFFTTLGTRGAASDEELRRQENKIVAAIRALDADIVGLVEVENGGPALGRLVAALNDGESGDAYAAVGESSHRVGDDDIRVALIYRPDRVQAVGAMQVFADPVYRGRPPIGQTFRTGTETFSVIAAHFKSKGGCNNATGPDRDQGDGQGCWNDLRVREAQRMLALVEDLRQSSGDGDVLVLGDLNAYGAEDPVVTLQQGGLIDLTHRFVELPERYSFVYRGLAGSLDYAFATPALAERATGAAYWHINADESRVLDYRAKGLPEHFRADPFRSSDHDPVLVGFRW